MLVPFNPPKYVKSACATDKTESPHAYLTTTQQMVKLLDFLKFENHIVISPSNIPSIFSIECRIVASG